MQELTALPARIAAKIDTNGPIPVDRPDLGRCWIWTAASDQNGYGQLGWEGRTWRAHQIVYFLLVGPRPEGLEPDHLCRTPACCNPGHLEWVTHRVNMLRAHWPNASKTECKHGHPFNEGNTYVSPHDGGRRCRTCLRRMKREYKIRQKVAHA